jgi:hypothetical protein
MQEFQVGDIVWVARLSQEQKQVVCPVCFSKKTVILILGDDSQVTLDCNYCSKGYEGPKGYVTEYIHEENPTLCTITSKEVRTDLEGTHITYHSGAYYFEDVGELLFVTKEEAQLRCNELLAAKKLEESTRAEYMKHDIHKSYTWNAGYHMRQVRDHEKQAEYHRGKALLCKAHTKTEVVNT